MYIYLLVVNLCIFIFCLFVLFILLIFYHVCVFYSDDGILKEILDNRIVSIIILALNEIGKLYYFAIFYWLDGSRLGELIRCTILLVYSISKLYALYVIPIIMHRDVFFHIFIQSGGPFLLLFILLIIGTIIFAIRIKMIKK